MLTLAKDAWGRRGTTEAWRKGAEGEEDTARALKPLCDRGWILINDLRIPGKRSNIDHVLIGPPGVFVIETKNYSGKLKLTGDTLTQNGRRRDSDIEEVFRETSAVTEALSSELANLSCPIRPILWIHGSPVEVGWFSEPVVANVRVGSSRRLVTWLRKLRPSLTPQQIERLAATLEERLTPA